MTITLPHDVEERFRLACMKKFGMKRGGVYSGFRESIILFIQSVEGHSYKELRIPENTLGQNPYPNKARVGKRRGRPPKSVSVVADNLVKVTAPNLHNPPEFTGQRPKLPESPKLTQQPKLTEPPKLTPTKLTGDFKLTYDHMTYDDLQKEYKGLQESGDRQYDEKLTYIAKLLTRMIKDSISNDKPLSPIEVEPQKKAESEYLL